MNNNFERFYDQKEAQKRIQPALMNFIDKLTERVYPNTVSVHGSFIIIWFEKDPCFGEKYLLQYDGVNAQWSFQGNVKRNTTGE